MSTRIPRDRPADDMGDGNPAPSMSMPVESVDDITAQVRKINERFEKRSAIYGQVNLIESYLNRDLGVGLRCVSGEFKQCGFVFQVVPLDILDGNNPGALSHEENQTWIDHAGDQPLMLSQNVELMEGPKQSVPSLVWAERFDDLDFRLREPLFSFDPVQWVKHVLMGQEDRKVRIFARRYAIACGQRGAQQIKGTSERPDDSTNFRMEYGRQRLFLSRYANHFPMWRIEVYRHQLDVRSLPGTEPPSEDWELGFTPLDGPYRIQEIITHD